MRLSRCWELLRPEGFLALLYNYKPLRPGAALARLAEVIERESGGRMRQSDYRDEVARWTKELEDSPFFTGLSVRRYPWAGRYTTAEYLGLFRTYSDYRSLPADAERRVAAAIQDAIDRNGGSVAVDYECVLFLTRKAREEQPTI